MATKLTIPFVEKEGKFFAPIISTEPKYIVQNGAVVQQGQKVVGGIKGVYAQVRIELPASAAGSKSELFALNTEFFQSSN